MADVLLAKLEPYVGDHQLAPPFGILYLASALEQAGFSVRLYHERGTPRAISRIVDDAVRERPIMVGFSTLTGPSLIPTLKAARELKRASRVPVVWGGLHPTMLPQQTLASACVDVAVTGEGEETVVELARALAADRVDGHALASVAGIVYRRNGDAVRTPARAFIQDLDRYSPAWHLLDIRKYFFHDRNFYSDMGSHLAAPVVASVITSRGCPWRCGYCYNQFVNHRSFRVHSAPRVIADIEDLKQNFGVGAFIIEDDCFLANRSRGMEIARHIGVPWNVSIRASELARWGEDFMKDLAATNCKEVRIGAESGSQRILDLVEKDVTIEQIRTAVDLCQRFGIRAALNFMIGIPGETREDRELTFALMDELEAMGPGVAVNGPSVFLPWPGTALYETAIRLGFEQPTTTEGWGVRWGPSQPRTPFIPGPYRLAGYYRFLAFRKETRFLRFPALARALGRLAHARWRRRFFRFPVDYYVPRLLLRLARRLGFVRLSEAVYE